MTQRQKIKLKKLGIIILTWLFIGVLISLYDYSLLTSGMSGGVSPDFNFGNNLMFNLAAAFFGALMVGSLLVYYVNERYRDKPYGFTVVAVLLSFIVVVAIITIILALIAAPLQAGKPLSDPETKKAFF